MRTTEQSSHYDHLDKMSTVEILTAMNTEDRTVPVAVAKVIPQIEKLVDGIVERMRRGGRVFYLGAGTSGRLGIVDASDGDWLYFDYVPGEIEIRRGAAAVTGRFCVIGSHFREDALKELFTGE